MQPASPRRVPVPVVPQYATVPQSPGSHHYYAGPSSATQHSTYHRSHHHDDGSGESVGGRGDTTHGVSTGQIGGGYGPYAYGGRDTTYGGGRFSAAASEASFEKPLPPRTTTTVPPYIWDKDPNLDDPLHNPDPRTDAELDSKWTLFSARGWANAIVLVGLLVGLITLFVGYPIISAVMRQNPRIAGFNIGGINGTGQVPVLPNLPTLIDKDTPEEAKTRTGWDGHDYELVFSDEFETEGRTFFPGDDPWWEAVDIHYWPTGDIEWYSPDAVTTAGGKMVITMTQERNHDMNFKSGMVQSWNKFCFSSGYIEVSVSLPGNHRIPGFWPGVWTLGNLGRAGYGATTEGMWPYSYAECDLGTFPNQTRRDGTPLAASTTGDTWWGGALSFLPGQRLSACTCPGSDHPGPDVTVGRGAPEIDILEAQIDLNIRRGEVSQSLQVAPYNAYYEFVNTTPATTVWDDSNTKINIYKGGVFQQAVSAVTLVEDGNYGGQGYGTYGFEYYADRKHREDGFVTWTADGQRTWTVTAAAVAADPVSEVGNRIIPEEPMSIIMNFGMSPSFQGQDFLNLEFPAKMYIDYVRIYQRKGSKNIGCSPKDYPTADYIERHIEAYTNPNLTTWAQAGNTFPRNRLYDGC